MEADRASSGPIFSYALTGSTGQIGPSPSTLPTSKPTGRRRMKKGNFQQTAGRSRGGRTTKIHALTEDRGRRSRS
jgi:hypothetical protein